MRFRLLGALEIEGDTGPLTLRGSKRRILIARLAVSRNQPVPAERLINDVWAGSPPPGASSTLSSHISLVRQLLGPGRLEHAGGGYRLIIHDGELDIAVFEEELQLGRRCAEGQDLRAASEHLGLALAEWRGPALVDLSDLGWARGETARLEEMRLAAEELLHEAQLGLGHHRDVVASAEAAVGSEPLREQRWATLMLALYRSGRQADALRAYQRLRRLLNEDLGMEPSLEVADLEQAIVLQSPELLWRPSPSKQAAGPSISVPGPDARSNNVIDDLYSSETAMFVGRSRELELLRRSHDTTTRGLLLLGGEPGIGKSALTAAFARLTQHEGVEVLVGRCFENVSVAYQPFVEALGRYVDQAPQELLRNHEAECGGDLARLLPGLARRLPTARPRTSSDPDADRFQTFSAVAGLLDSAARDRPLLLIIEDLHWADASTLQLFRHVIDHSRSSGLTVLATFRSSEIVADSPHGEFLAECWRDQQLTRLDLVGLEPLDVRALCQELAPNHHVEEEALSDFVESISAETAGNPLYLRELLRHLAGSTNGVGLRSDDLPPSLQDVIGQRVSKLGAKVARLLALASVIGVEFELATLGRVAEIERDELFPLIEQAVSAELIRTGDEASMRFAHAIVHRTLYQSLLPVRRRQLHGKVALALEQSTEHPNPSNVAFHYLGANELEPALRWAERAGYDAVGRVAPDDAAQWFAKAAELVQQLHPEEVLRRRDLMTQLGVALFQTGRSTYRSVLLEAGALAEASGDGRRMAMAALANTRGYYSAAGLLDHERLATLRRTLSAVGDTDRMLRSLLTAAICSESVFGTPLSERRDLADQAKTDARALGDARTTVTVHNLVIEALRFPTELAQRLEDTAVAVRLAEGMHDPGALFWAASHRMRTLVESGVVHEALEQFTRMTAICARLGQPVMQWMTAYSEAQWALLRGDTTQGERLAEEAFAIGERFGQPDALNYFATQLSHARWQQGRLEELVGMIEQGGRDNPGIPAYLGALARAKAQAGDPDGATTLLDSAFTTDFSELPQDLLWTYGMVTYAEVAIRLDQPGAAAVLYEQLRPFDSQVCFVGTTCEGPIAHYLGGLATVLGRFDEARPHFDIALSFAQAADSPYFHARTTIEAGLLAQRSGDISVARHLIANGRSIAQHGSFLGELRRADEVLAGIAR